MSSYHAASTIVKPKMNFLRLQTAKLEVTLKELAGAEAELNATRRKMEQANNLINDLAGEKARWTEDSNTFADRRKKLVGNVAMASAFVTYCGPFNSELRDRLVTECRSQGSGAAAWMSVSKEHLEQPIISENIGKGLAN